MKNIGEHLKVDYIYARTFFAESELFHSDKILVSIDDILRAHYLITDYFENHVTHKKESSFYGLLKPHMLGSAYSRQFVTFGGKSKYESKLEICATLFYGINKAHAFNDGNKRTALLTLLMHLDRCGRIPIAEKKDFENLTVNVAADTYSGYSFIERYKEQDDFQVKMITHFLRKNTREKTTSYRSITFQEMEQALKRQKIFFSTPEKNFVDVTAEKSTFFGKRSEKLCTISYPGSKRQVAANTIKLIMDKYKERIGHELDAGVLYENVEPMYKLIEEFEGPLMRLKDR